MTDVYVDLRDRGILDLEPVRAGIDQISEENDSLYVIISRLDTDNTEPITELMREAGLQVQKRSGHDGQFMLRGFFRHRD